METVDSREIALRDQIRLGLEPMLHFVTWPGTFVFVAEVGHSGHFVRRGREVNFILVQASGRGWRGGNDGCLAFG